MRAEVRMRKRMYPRAIKGPMMMEGRVIQTMTKIRGKKRNPARKETIAVQAKRRLLRK